MRKIVLILMGCFIATGLCRADMLTADFTIKNNLPSASSGQVTFTLNGNGTITGSVMTSDGNIFGLGFNSVGHMTSSNFSPAEYQDTSWGDPYGIQASGFICSPFPCTIITNSLTWTIGTVGEFTSVFQALGGTTSTHDFFLGSTNGNDWAADVASTPEPSSLIPLVGILMALAYAVRVTRFSPDGV
jgi:hypothetical protein